MHPKSPPQPSSATSSTQLTAQQLEQEFLQRIHVAKNQLESLPWERGEVYWSWLSQTSHFVDWTTRLISLAAGSCTLAPASSDFHQFLVLHLREEFNHDLIAKQDLARLKERDSRLPEIRQTEFEVTFNFHQSLRRRLMMDLPFGEFALLGRMLFLEGLAAKFGPQLAALVSRHHGEDCGRFIALHGEADQEHLQEDLAKLKDLEPAQLDIIRSELQRTTENYLAITLEWREFAQRGLQIDERAPGKKAG